MPSPTLSHRNTLAFFGILVCATSFIGVRSALAFDPPEQVLLNSEFFLPPSARESRSRQTRQAEISDLRRSEQLQKAITEQHPAPVKESTEKEEEDVTEEAALPAGLSASDLELLRTVRLLDRITGRQQTPQVYYGALPMMQMQGGDALHSGAPLLAPTGAGAWLAATVVIGAVFWTLRRARKSESNVVLG